MLKLLDHKAVKQKEALAFKQGYYLAVAVLVRQHGSTTEAEDLLHEFGPVDFTGIDSYDLEVLKPLAKEIARKRKSNER